MYVLSLVVWAALGTAPVVDATKFFKTFEECETTRIKYNDMYESELQKNAIAGYESSCKFTKQK
jgi:hypothetical protein